MGWFRDWFQRDTRVEETVVGKSGRVTGRIGAGRVGEVMLPIRGATEAFNAYPYFGTETFELNQMVSVVEATDSRTVLVVAAN